MNIKSSESRRKLLKSIAAGSGAVIAGKSLPENWSKPVVDSVLLPIHAQTTATTCTITMIVTGPLGQNENVVVPSGSNIPRIEYPISFVRLHTFTGTVSPPELGARAQVQLSWSAPDGSSGQTSGTISADGTWSIGPRRLVFGEIGTATTYVATTACATADATWYFVTVENDY